MVYTSSNAVIKVNLLIVGFKMSTFHAVSSEACELGAHRGASATPDVSSRLIDLTRMD